MQIKKDEVDQSCNQQGQRFPYCRLSVEWTKEEEPINLEHIVDLKGASSPNNYVCMKLCPDNTGTANISISKATQEVEFTHVTNMCKCCR